MRDGSGNLHRLLRPGNVVFIGGEDAEIAARECTKFGFGGSMWAVNPNRDTLAGIPCHRDVEALPGVPDVAFLGVPKSATPRLLRSLRDKGTGAVVAFTAGYAEQGEAGRREQDALIAEAGAMALLGPNCYGLINAVDGIALWPYFHGCRRVGRGVALVSQSGMLATSLSMNRRAVDFSFIVSTGNQGMLGAEDFIEALDGDPSVAAFALYVEGVRDADRFVGAVRRAVARGTPVIALQAGVSDTGAGIIARHTASDPGSVGAIREMLCAAGAVRVTSPNELLETAKFLSGAAPMRGTRMAAFTCSGGDAAILADCGAAHGISFPQPSPAVAERLSPLLPDIACVSNPLDCTTKLWGSPDIARVFAALLEDDYDVALFIQDWPRPDIPFDKETDLREAADFAAAARARGIPAVICSTLSENMDRETRAQLLAAGAIPMQGVDHAMAAIAKAAGFAQATARYRAMAAQ